MRTQGVTVLLIIEDGNLAFGLKSALSRERFNVLLATDTEEAITLAKEYYPALIITEMLTSSIDGRKIKQVIAEDKITTGIPFIFLAESLYEGNKGASQIQDIDYVVGKPFGIHEVLERVSILLHSGRRVNQEADAEGEQVIRNTGDGSFLDELTQLYNRNFLEVEIKRLTSGRQFPVSVITADIDNLKKVNDTMGYQKGDELLCQAANVIRVCFRPDEIIARVNGDEFVVVLPSMQSESAKLAVERIKKSVVEYNLSRPALRLSLSVGWATAQLGDDLRRAVHSAEEKMLQEKCSKVK